jgi:hypothetical protein
MGGRPGSQPDGTVGALVAFAKSAWPKAFQVEGERFLVLSRRSGTRISGCCSLQTGSAPTIRQTPIRSLRHPMAPAYASPGRAPGHYSTGSVSTAHHCAKDCRVI